MTRVVGAGTYLPAFRIETEALAEAWGRAKAGGVREKAVAGADEDALTMGTAAAEAALTAAGTDPADLALVALGTTTPPLAEEDPTPRLGAFLGVPEDTASRYLTGSTRAGTGALVAAIDADRLPALVVAADCPRGEPNSEREHAAGAGAAAFVLAGESGSGGDGARVTARGEYGADYPGTRFREWGDDRVRGLGITSYDRQAFRECTAGAVEAADPATDPEALALQAPDGTLPDRVAPDLAPAAERIAVAADCGDLGAASAPMGLARALDSGHESTLVVGYGSGSGAEALLVEGTAPVARDEREPGQVGYSTYLRLRDELTSEPPAGGGAQVSVPSWRRSRAARYRLAAGRCPDCGALSFPAEGACGGCHGLVDYEGVRLAREGRVETATRISPGGAPPEFVPQAERGGDFGVAIVAFGADGPPDTDAQASASVPVQVTDDDEVSAGDRVEAVVRRVYTQEGVPRYGRKVRSTD